MTDYFLACDLGAESGRIMLGSLMDGKLGLEEVHRFPNGPVKHNGSFHWDMPRLFREFKDGLRKAAAEKVPMTSVSADSWGVDYLLFDSEGRFTPPAFHYRDPRTAVGVEAVRERLTPDEIFEETGIQFMPINALYQLAAEDPKRLEEASFLLGVGDAMNYQLAGRRAMDESMASTFQLFNPVTRRWSEKLIQRMGFPERLFPEVVSPGTVLGPMLPDTQRETQLGPISVIATCSHDTGAAVVAAPSEGDDWAYISSGTWSLMGVELPAPILTDECRRLNFTNEIGFGGSTRLLKNISGLWILQELRREWAANGFEFDYGELSELAAREEPFKSLINPASPQFLSPENMEGKIVEFCRAHKQPPPERHGQFARCVFESLALLYRKTLRELETITSRRIQRLHIFGGGGKNTLLNQFAANSLQIPILAGPVEATAAGNVLVQAIALKRLSSLAEARSVVRASSAITRFTPQEREPWEIAFERFEKICDRP